MCFVCVLLDNLFVFVIGVVVVAQNNSVVTIIIITNENFCICIKQMVVIMILRTIHYVDLMPRYIYQEYWKGACESS